MTTSLPQEVAGQRELLGYLAGLPVTRPRANFLLQEVGLPKATPQHLLLGHRQGGTSTVAFTARKALQAYLDYCLFQEDLSRKERQRAEAIATDALTDYYLFQEPLAWTGGEWENLLKVSKRWGMKPRRKRYWRERLASGPLPLEEWLLISLGEVVAVKQELAEATGLLPFLLLAGQEGFLLSVGNVMCPLGWTSSLWQE